MAAATRNGKPRTAEELAPVIDQALSEPTVAYKPKPERKKPEPPKKAVEPFDVDIITREVQIHFGARRDGEHVHIEALKFVCKNMHPDTWEALRLEILGMQQSGWAKRLSAQGIEI